MDMLSLNTEHGVARHNTKSRQPLASEEHCMGKRSNATWAQTVLMYSVAFAQ